MILGRVTGNVVATVKHASLVGHFAWSSDGQSLILGHENGWIDVWDVANGQRPVAVSTWRAHDDAAAYAAYVRRWTGPERPRPARRTSAGTAT